MKELEKIKAECSAIEPEIPSILHGLTLHELDLSFLGESINKAIGITTSKNGIAKETVFFTMLPIVSTACGMNTFMNPGVVLGNIKPNLFCVNILRSGGAKSQISSLLLKETLNPLSEELYRITQEEIDSLVVDKDNGPLYNAKDRSEERERIRLRSHKPILSKVSPAALMQYAGNGALMLFFDEIASFINSFVIGDREVTLLTELYQTYRSDKVLIGRSDTEVWDSSLSLYAHGTPELAKQMVTPKMQTDGSSWRFCFNVDIKEPLTLSFAEYLAKSSDELPDFETFYRMFNNIKLDHFKNETPKIYTYEEEALQIKSFLSKKLQWLADSLDEKGSRTSSMLLKLPALLDKMSLLHHLMRSNLGDSNVFTLRDSKIVKADSVSFAWDFAKKVFTGWNMMIQLRESKDLTSEIEKNTIKKKTKNDEFYSQILTDMGGPGTYSIEKWEQTLVEFKPFLKEKRHKSRFKKWCSEGDFALIKDNKITLSNV
jgi:hypothetical protein